MKLELACGGLLITPESSEEWQWVKGFRKVLEMPKTGIETSTVVSSVSDAEGGDEKLD